MTAKASVVFGFVYQKMTVTASAPRLASHARSHGRSSTRFIERARTTKKIAIVSDDAICAVVLQRHKSSSMGGPAALYGCGHQSIDCSTEWWNAFRRGGSTRMQDGNNGRRPAKLRVRAVDASGKAAAYVRVELLAGASQAAAAPARQG